MYTLYIVLHNIKGWNENEDCRSDTEHMDRKQKMKKALRKFTQKDDNESRIKYWESRKKYENTTDNKNITMAR